MRIGFNLIAAEGATALAFRSRWGLAPEVGLRLCFGMGHATREVVAGLFRKFPHKTSVALQSDFGGFWEDSLTYCTQEGIKATRFTSANGDSIVLDETSSRSLLLVGVAEDDPLTGELQDWSRHAEAAEKFKVPFVRISSSAFLREKQPIAIAPYEIRILQISPQVTALLTGEKVKLDRLIQESPDFKVEDMKSCLEPLVENRQRVETFENSMNFGRTLLSGRSRLFDRAVLSFSNVDGSALSDLLSRRLGIVDEESPGKFQRMLQNSSDCSPENRLRPTSWRGALKARGWSEDEIRGLLVLDLSLLNETTVEELAKCHKDLLKMQGMPV